MINSELLFAAQAQAFILHGLHWSASAIELFGVMVIVCGVVVATAWAFADMREGGFADARTGSHQSVQNRPWFREDNV